MAIKGTELASAYVSLSFSVDKLPQQLKRALRDVDLDSFGEDAGEKLGDGMAKGGRKSAKRDFGPAMSKALGQELRKAGDKGSRELLRELSKGGEKAEKEAAIAGRNYANALRDAMNGKGTEAADKWEKEFRNAIKARDNFKALRVDVDTRSARRDVDALSSNLFKLGRSDFLKLNIGAAAISGLPALAAGLGEVTAAMVQLSQAALAVPGGIAGAAASFGTLALGVSGLSDAYDALNAVQDEAATNSKQVAQQQRSQRSASFGLRNALVDHEQAQQDVNRAMRDARRDLQDLNLEMRGGIISEKRAVLEAQRARERLATGDYTDVRDALLDVEEADLRVAETRRRNIRTSEDLTEANVKGIAGSDQVVAANERLIRSEQGVVQAQDAVAAAADTSTSAQEKAALAMSKLSPNAQAVVNTLMDLQGPFQSLKFLVQDNMFAGIAGGMSDLAGKSMPMLERGLGGIGTAWNRTFEEILNVAGTDETQTMLERIFGNTEEAQNILTEGIEPLVSGLGTLTEAGTRALPRLADGFVGALERFDDFITAADEDGRLDQWIDEGITALGQLGETALNIGKIFTGIGDAAEGSLLANLERWTTNWANWVNSVEGQETIQDIFREGKEIFETWKPILDDLPELFMSIYEGSKTWIEFLTTALEPVTGFLADHGELLEALVVGYLALSSAKVLGSIATLGGALDGLSTKFGTPGKGGSGLLGQVSMFAAAAVLLQETPAMTMQALEELFGEGGGFGKLFDGFGSKRSPVGTDAATGTPGVDALGTDFFTGVLPPMAPSKGPEGGLQINTINVKRAIEAQFPKIETIGGYRQDSLKWHPNGLALDVMIPGGTTRGGRNPEGKRYGDQIWAWLKLNGPALGVDLGASLWQTDTGGDHYDHIHVATTGGGYPGGGGAPSSGGSAPAHPWNAGGTPTPQPNQGANPAPAASPAPTRGSGPLQDILGGGGPAAAPFTGNPVSDLFLGIPTYDQGGPWPDGTLGINTSGADEFVLNPQDLQWLQSQGIDPSTLQHGAGGGTPVAPGPQRPPGAPGRMEGYIPAAAGNTGKVGEGGLSNFLDLGESFFHNLIDSGAQLGSMAVSAAAAAGSFGAGAAAGPAASAGIQMGAEAGKRLVSYGYDMAGIWGEAIVEQLFPFGAPRWLGSASPMAFMPQGLPMGEQGKAPGTMGVAKTALSGWAQPGNPAMASMGNGSQGGQAALDAARAMPSYTPKAPNYTPQTAAPPAAPPQIDPMNPASWLNFAGIFDQGGVWEPNSFGLNLSGKPEYVMTQAQMASMAKTAGAGPSGRGGDTNNFYATDVESAIREWQKNKRRQSRQHSGRPF